MVHIGYWLRGSLLILALLSCCFADASNQGAIARASALFSAGKVKQAEAVLRTASAADPDSVPLHGALGELLFNEQKFEDCIQELNIVVGADPSSRKYTILLAEALIGTRRWGVAVDLLDAARPRFGDYFQFHYDLGLAYYFMNKIDQAQPEFEEALRLSPTFGGCRTPDLGLSCCER